MVFRYCTHLSRRKKLLYLKYILINLGFSIKSYCITPWMYPACVFSAHLLGWRNYTRGWLRWADFPVPSEKKRKTETKTTLYVQKRSQKKKKVAVYVKPLQNNTINDSINRKKLQNYRIFFNTEKQRNNLPPPPFSTNLTSWLQSGAVQHTNISTNTKDWEVLSTGHSPTRTERRAAWTPCLFI